MFSLFHIVLKGRKAVCVPVHSGCRAILILFPPRGCLLVVSLEYTERHMVLLKQISDNFLTAIQEARSKSASVKALCWQQSNKLTFFVYEATLCVSFITRRELAHWQGTGILHDGSTGSNMLTVN